MTDKSAGGVTPSNRLLFGVHHRVPNTLSWLQVAEYMKNHTPEHIQCKCSRPRLRRIELIVRTTLLGSRLFSTFLYALRLVWRRLPTSIRSIICQRLRLVGYCTYGSTLSDRIYRLPFGLYPRIDQACEGLRHHAEFETLRLVENHTTIPAPRPIDAFQYKEKSYLHMTRVLGRPIGTLLDGMTDMQLHKATRELTEYIAQLRTIPNTRSNTLRICNSFGVGILDWRIGDSQRRKLTFITVAEFHQCLAAGYSKEIQEKAGPSHGKNHDVVFTHGDLIPLNVLADKTGTVTGIVDWECSGWYPEYWEYTKAYFAVRYTIRWLTDVIDQFFTGYREELRVENMLTSYGHT